MTKDVICMLELFLFFMCVLVILLRYWDGWAAMPAERYALRNEIGEGVRGGAGVQILLAWLVVGF
jgi:hypothetical protein